MTYIGVILCEKSIARIPESWKRFLDPNSGKESVYWSENKHFWIFMKNRRFLGFSGQRIDCAHSQTLKTLPWLWFRKGIGVLKRKSIYLRKESYINVVRVDFYYKQMCSRVLYLMLGKDFFYFSLNQGQGSVFKVRECAQSIPRLEKPKSRRFSHKFPA